MGHGEGPCWEVRGVLTGGVKPEEVKSRRMVPRARRQYRHGGGSSGWLGGGGAEQNAVRLRQQHVQNQLFPEVAWVWCLGRAWG